MTTGYILIVAILILGGVIATVGDRIGMKVGKARLTLFNLRPRQTATVVSVLTGSIISASTLGILFGISSQLRTGVFELGEIQDDLKRAEQELQQVTGDRQRIETELETAQLQQREAQARLASINEFLDRAIARQEATQAQLNATQSELSQAESSYQRAQEQLRSVSQQERQLRSAVQRLEAERQTLLQREAEIRAQITERDAEIAEQDAAISQQKRLLDELNAEKFALSDEVERLRREASGLRRGDVALARNQVLTSGVLRVVQPEAAPQAIQQLFREANRVAYRNIWPLPGSDNPEEQLISISAVEVERLIQAIQDGEEYVVRILSAANYVVGEPCVLDYAEPCIQVFVDAVPNQVVFEAGEIVAVAPVESTNLSDRGLLERLNILIATSQFRSRQAGVVAETLQVADGDGEAIVRFLEQIQQYNQTLDMQAIAAAPIYAAGPIRVELIAVQDGEILFGTADRFNPDDRNDGNAAARIR